MLLSHCIKKNLFPLRGAASVLLGLAIVTLGACGSSGPPKAAAAKAPAASERAASASASDSPAADPQAKSMFEQAVAVMTTGDPIDAELRFKEFLQRYPDTPGAYVNLAILYAKSGNDKAVAEAIDKALTINPNFPAALNQKGMLLRRNGKFPEAEAAYMKAVTADPDYALAHYNLGVLYELYMQHLDAALQQFEAYQALVGDDAEVEKWIADLERRVAANQRTANVGK